MTKRITINELAPEDFRSTFWQGGMPYISVSHYPDLEGKAVPGTVERVFVDGNQLKADGQFSKTSLGFACYYSISKDLYEEPKSENPVRVSIAFLDFGHTHKSDNYRFIRDSILDFCPKCIEEHLKGKSSGKIFEKGQLVHLALTRVPANERTSMEVEKSMTTRKEDATSIIGEELADDRLAERVFGSGDVPLPKVEWAPKATASERKRERTSTRTGKAPMRSRKV